MHTTSALSNLTKAKTTLFSNRALITSTNDN